jgi:hypothetical protein
MCLRDRRTGVTMTHQLPADSQRKPTRGTVAKLALYATNDATTTMTQGQSYCDDCGTELKAFEVYKDGKVVGTELACPNAGYCGQHN